MARIRKFVAYRRLERPYTRMSKYKQKNFVRTRPNITLVKYDLGDLSKTFPYELTLVSKDNLQIRHNALESARMTSNRALEKYIGKTGWKLKVNVFPHHILRENPLASGAGADRMSTGMKKSFGKSIGTAARIKKGQKIFTIQTTKPSLPTAKLALERAGKKLPCSTLIKIEKKK
ncbi:50S ribosomal protein L16 [Candidatus Woesearchaeota archaeon]|nr:50S ribosomal protein L16 [Candidatus Woesearchaeota archaeon]